MCIATLASAARVSRRIARAPVTPVASVPLYPGTRETSIWRRGGSSSPKPFEVRERAAVSRLADERTKYIDARELSGFRNGIRAHVALCL